MATDHVVALEIDVGSAPLVIRRFDESGIFRSSGERSVRQHQIRFRMGDDATSVGDDIGAARLRRSSYLVLYCQRTFISRRC